MERFHYSGEVCNGKKRIAVYCRVSTLKEEQELSFETQCAYYRSLIEKTPELTLVGVYGDHGLSGLSTEKRVEFRRLMEDCMSGRVDEVWTKSISRFARSLADCVACVRRLRERRIAVVFEKEGINTLDPGGEMVLSVLAACAQEESRSMSANMRWANEQRNQSGRPSMRAAYGYRRVRGDRKNTWIIDEEEARRIRLLFSMAARGTVFSEMIEALNRMEEEAGTGEVWSRHRIRYAIASEAYIGDLLTNKNYTIDCFDKKLKRNRGEVSRYYIERHHEPLVDRRTHALANRMLRVGALNSALTEAHRRKLAACAFNWPDGEPEREGGANE